MSSTREVAIGIVNQVAIGCWQFQSEGWLIDAIDQALRQREQEVRAEERERIAQMLDNGSDGVGGDWEASEAAGAVREGTV